VQSVVVRAAEVVLVVQLTVLAGDLLVRQHVAPVHQTRLPDRRELPMVSRHRSVSVPASTAGQALSAIGQPDPVRRRAAPFRRSSRHSPLRAAAPKWCASGTVAGHCATNWGPSLDGSALREFMLGHWVDKTSRHVGAASPSRWIRGTHRLRRAPPGVPPQLV
jgi:hypothetical protein